MFCKKCGEAIPEDSVFCPMCGAVQQESSERTSEGKEKSKIDKAVGILGTVVASTVATAATALVNEIVTDSMKTAGKALKKKGKNATHKTLKFFKLENENVVDKIRKIQKNKKKR